MKNRLDKNRQKGFLLIEVLVAIVIITVALVPIAGMFIQSTQATRNASQFTVATNLAQEQLELLKSWTPLKWTTATSPVPWQGTGASPIELNNVNYDVETVVNPCPEINSANLVQVTVTVSWNSGSSGSVVMTAFYPKI